MPVQSYRMGPGSLILGADPDDADASAQVTSCTVTAEENVDTQDAVPVLSGDELAAEDDVSLSWTIAGNVVQDLASGGLVAYTWDNASEAVPFVFIPNTVADRQVSGVCRLIPIAIGGEAKSRPQSDFTWAVVGTPVFAAAP